VADAGLGAGRPSYDELVVLVAELRAENRALRERIEELERRLGQSSRNSSMPPSSDPPASRAERRRLAREQVKRLSTRKPGGQPGHEGKHRQMAACEQVAKTFEHSPVRCGGCRRAFTGSEERAGDPVVHQKWELPPMVPLIFEHRRLRLACPGCGKTTLAALPVGVSASAFGPRLEAHIATLAGVYRLSRRQTAEVIQSIFHIPISTGAVDATIMRMSVALADPWAKLAEAVRQAEVVHADETSWRLAGAQQWLWLGAAALTACFRIDRHRSQAAAKELLGEDFGGIVVTDRYAAYHFLDILQQQLCWAHVIRQLVALSEGPGASGRRGEKLVAAARQVIAVHRTYLQDAHDLAWLKAQLSPLRERIHTLLEEGTRARHQRTANFCAALLDEYEALWTFCEVPEIQPTNNRAERALRHAVIMRKTQLHTQSENGNRWIERILSINETCRLQGRAVLDYLTQAAVAAHHGQPAPSLLPSGP
jgi:transposase